MTTTTPVLTTGEALADARAKREALLTKVRNGGSVTARALTDSDAAIVLAEVAHEGQQAREHAADEATRKANRLAVADRIADEVLAVLAEKVRVEAEGVEAIKAALALLVTSKTDYAVALPRWRAEAEAADLPFQVVGCSESRVYRQEYDGIVSDDVHIQRELFSVGAVCESAGRIVASYVHDFGTAQAEADTDTDTEADTSGDDDGTEIVGTVPVPIPAPVPAIFTASGNRVHRGEPLIVNGVDEGYED